MNSAFRSAEDFCHIFDLTCRIPETIIQSVTVSGHFVAIPVSSPYCDGSPAQRVLSDITRTLEQTHSGAKSSTPLRICIPSLGSYQWGDLSPQVSQPYTVSNNPYLSSSYRTFVVSYILWKCYFVDILTRAPRSLSHRICARIHGAALDGYRNLVGCPMPRLLCLHSQVRCMYALSTPSIVDSNMYS